MGGMKKSTELLVIHEIERLMNEGLNENIFTNKTRI